jgi:hypothetical protein
MKSPRIDAFVSITPKKKLPELKSSLDTMPVIEKPKSPNKTATPQNPVALTSQEKRAIRTRHPFDIYEDQYQELRTLSLEMQMKGTKSSMSKMVREALDMYLSTKKKPQ